MSIGIHYYYLTNKSASTIYPMLMDKNNTDTHVWSGRDSDGTQYEITEGNYYRTNLALVTPVGPWRDFYLGENTALGKDFYDGSQLFHFDPKSDLVAYAERDGSLYLGSLTWKGNKPIQ